ncbi:Ig-like domain-containing protein [Rhodovibrio sodomensis]|uniref:Ig-like domain-containing protein n=1 Tax=Rhodovibrio sodomensis TaxID=1088 RepID=UPI00190781E1
MKQIANAVVTEPGDIGIEDILWSIGLPTTAFGYKVFTAAASSHGAGLSVFARDQNHLASIPGSGARGDVWLDAHVFDVAQNASAVHLPADTPAAAVANVLPVQSIPDLEASQGIQQPSDQASVSDRGDRADTGFSWDLEDHFNFEPSDTGSPQSRALPDQAFARALPSASQDLSDAGSVSVRDEKPHVDVANHDAASPAGNQADVELALSKVRAEDDPAGPVVSADTAEAPAATPPQQQEPSTKGGTSKPETPGEEGASGYQEIIVRTTIDAPQDLHETFDAVVGDRAPELGVELWSVPDRMVDDLLSGLHPHVYYAERNGKVQLETTVASNDPRLDDQWALDNANDRDIDWNDAQRFTTDARVTVGVIDTGIDYTHPDLDDNMWINPGEIAGNGIDDDSNGFVDDVYGWDFRNGDNDPFDDHSHGTHVAGTIGAETDNGTGVAGVSTSANLMALKAMSSDGYGSYYDVARALNYAVDMGAEVSNISWGGGYDSTTLRNAIKDAGKVGHMVVAAAGNNGRDTDSDPFYPASYADDNVISVAATNSVDGKPSWSNYGATSVDLGAPGASILSTMPGGGYGNKSGTSMASPHVAGAVAQVWAQDPSQSYQEVKQLILDNVNLVSSMDGRTVSGGRLNLAQALEAVPTSVDAVDDQVAATEDTSIEISVLSNDSDAEGDGLDITDVVQPDNGSVSIIDNGRFDGSDTIRFTPDTDFFGTATFSYRASDGTGDSDAATVTVNVENANDAPLANGDTAFLAPDTSIEVRVLSNDEDVDGDGLDIASVTQPTNGTVTINDNGAHDGTDTLTYAPVAGYTGGDSFSYTVTDPSGASSTASVDITVDDSAQTIAQLGRITDLTHEAQTIQLDHSFANPVVFALTPSYNGGNYSTVRVTDVQSTSFSARIQEAAYEDDLHTPEDVSFLVMEAGSWQLGDGTRLEVGKQTSDNLTGNGFETVTFSSAFDAAPAVFSQVQTTNDTSFVQTRQQGADSQGFSLAMEHEEARASTAHASEQVGWFAIDQGTGSWDGQAFQAGSTANAVTDASYSLSFDGSLSFDRAPQFFASMDSFDGPDAAHIRYSNLGTGAAEFAVYEDQSADSETGHTDESVSFLALQGSGTLTGAAWGGADTTITATDDTTTTDEDTAVELSVLANDTGENLDIASVTQPTNGTVTINDKGVNDGTDTLTYTPNANYTGKDSFTYTITDDSGTTSEGSVTVDVAAVNDAPTATPDSASTRIDTAVEIGVLSNDEDVDGDGLDIASVTQPTNGTVKINDNGAHDGTDTLNYAPAAGYTGSDSFTYTITDPSGASSTASVDLTVDDSAQTIAQLGRITDLTHEAQTIQLDHSFTNPVVFALTPSYNGGDYSTVRITDVQGDSFSARVQEATYEDDRHTTEDVSFLVMEEGSWQLGDGTRLEVGKQTSDNLTGNGFDTVTFSSAFDAAPAVFSQVQTTTDTSFVQTRQQGADSQGFSLALEHEEARASTAHASEQVGWFAIDQGTGSWDGQAFQAGSTANAVTDASYSLNFDGSISFDQAPQFFAQLASFDGPDAAHVRYDNLGTGETEIRVAEDQSFDWETSHTDEIVDFLGIVGHGTLDGFEYT